MLLRLLTTFVCAGAFAVSGAVQGATLSDVEMSEQMTVGEQALVLNGMGLRRVERFGIPVKVYVGGLYLVKKSKAAEEIFAQSTPKVIRMVFVRSVDAEKLVEAFEGGHRDNCLEDCEASKKALKEFTRKIPNARNKGQFEIQFWPDRVDYDFAGSVKGTVPGAAFSKNLLAVFLGKKPPTDDLKSGLLGLK